VLVVVTDAMGHILAHPDRQLIGQPLSAEPRLAQALGRWVEAGRPVESSGVRLGDSQRLVVVAGAVGPEWVIWRSRLRADVLAPLLAGRSEALKWAAAIVAGMGLAVLLLVNGLLRPLSRLEARALHLFDGKHDPQAGWPNASGEIGRLEKVLRHMGAERTQLEAHNSVVIKQLESVMASAPVGIIFSRNKQMELVSAHACALLGRSRDELVGQPAQSIYASNEDYQVIGPKVAAAFATTQPFAGEVELLRGDGSRFWARLRGSPVDWAGSSAGTIWTINDITEEITARQALQWAATHDPLTGLANRKAFDDRLKHLFDALPRSRPAVLLMFDLDRFKPINDQHGHAAGDAMLRAVAAAASAHLRPNDLVVRLGGDEFAVLLERCPADVALRVAEELRLAICNIRLPWDGVLLELGASIGVAALSDHIHEPEAWVAAADRACYEAKAAGRNTVRHAGGPALHLVAHSAVA
jgi:diguanylate cyclase